MKDYVDLFGRLALSILFVTEAYDSIIYWNETKKIMATYGLTWTQDILLWTSTVFLIVGSLMLITGYRSKLAAFLLLCYWLPVTFVVYSFWNESGDAFRDQAIHFVENLAIAGGLMLIVAHGTGKFAIKKLFATARVPR